MNLKISVLTVVFSIILACSDNEKKSDLTYSANLTGANEVPALPTSTTGTAIFTIKGSNLVYSINLTGADSVTLAHIHKNVSGQKGGIYLGLYSGPITGSGFNGTLIQSTVPLPSDFTSLVDTDSLYVNVHTRKNSGGEIRGQIIRVSSNNNGGNGGSGHGDGDHGY